MTESYGHAAAVARLKVAEDRSKAVAEAEFARGDWSLEKTADVENIGAYLLHKARLICAQVHDQAECCPEHYHHLARSITFSPDGSSCTVCRPDPHDSED